jgi:hypothetical protein
MNTVEVNGAVKSLGEKDEQNKVLCGFNMTVTQGSM